MYLYFICDDWCNSLGREGFAVYFGNAHHTAIGTKQGEYRTLREAIASIPAGETIMRVFLARRHGRHIVRRISRTDADIPAVPFLEHGVYVVRGFNPYGLHFNRSFRTLRLARDFAADMFNGNPDVSRY